jgi:hypothetical protein
MARIRNLVISDVAGDSVVTAMFRQGFDSGLRPYRITQGLPADAKLVGLAMLENPKALKFTFESQAFEDVENPDDLPSLVVLATAYSSQPMSDFEAVP